MAVLLGGPSSEREVSLASGAAVARGLEKAGYEVARVDPQDGQLDLPAGIEAAFIVLHGSFGEDGTVQDLLTQRGIPYTGCGVESSRVCFDKRLSKARFSAASIPTPAYEVLGEGDERTLPLPVVIKPPLQGSTIGIHRVFEEEEWAAAFADALQYDGEVLVEEFVEGAELTVGVVAGQVLPIVEIRAPGGYYDFKAKYTKGESEYLVPAPLSEEDSATCRDLGLRVYEELACRGMARVDIRLSPEGRPYVLEVNNIPGFTETSLLPMAAQAAGIEFSELCDRIIRTACL